MKIKTLINRSVIFIVTSFQLFMLSLLVSSAPFTIVVIAAYMFDFVKSSMNLWLLFLIMATVIFVGINIYFILTDIIDRKQQKKAFEYFHSLNEAKEFNNGTH